ncbi:hypothetical protein [Halorientalis salina]|uniref:hypothetical protein n=1 Tax=Halorientalis salina TaxID=2932266 RepID=UPI0010ABCF49|nr:hypothetical protein [Halorientalis salina]
MSDYQSKGRCRRTAEQIIKDGIQNWQRETKRVAREDEYETLLDCRTEIREAYREGQIADEDLYDNLLLKIEEACLVLATADYTHRGPDGTIAAQYPEGVLKKLKTLDGYRQYDVYDADSETLQQRIASRDGKLYDLIRDEVAPQLETLNEALTGTDSSLSDREMKAVERLASDRLSDLQEAVGVYIRYNGLPNVADEMEDAVLKAAEAANQRATIGDELSDIVEDSLDEFSQSLHQSIRDERRELTDELHRLTYDSGDNIGQDRVDRLLNRVDTLLERQEEQQEALHEQIAMHRKKLSSLEETIDGLEEALSEEELAEQYEQLLTDQLEQLREQKAEIAAQVSELRSERAELEATREELEINRSALEHGELPVREEETTDTVYATEARIAEFDYSSRFETAVHEAPEISLPDGDTFAADSSYWRKNHSRSDNRQKMRQLLTDYQESVDNIDRVLGQYPLGRKSRFVVRESGRLPISTQRRLVLEARILPHLEMFARYGADDRPGTEADLLEVVNDVVRNAESEDTRYILAVGSPTGWTDTVERSVARGNAVSFSRQVDLVLVDLQSRRIIYDETEPLLKDNSDLFSFKSRNEVTSDCIKRIREEYIGSVDHVSVDTVVAQNDFDEYTVSRAFTRLDEAGTGTRRQRSDGLYLDL